MTRRWFALFALILSAGALGAAAARRRRPTRSASSTSSASRRSRCWVPASRRRRGCSAFASCSAPISTCLASADSCSAATGASRRPNSSSNSSGCCRNIWRRPTPAGWLSMPARSSRRKRAARKATDDRRQPASPATDGGKIRVEWRSGQQRRLEDHRRHRRRRQHGGDRARRIRLGDPAGRRPGSVPDRSPPAERSAAR